MPSIDKQQIVDCQLSVELGHHQLFDQQPKIPSQKRTLATDDNFGHTTDLSLQKANMSEKESVLTR